MSDFEVISETGSDFSEISKKDIESPTLEGKRCDDSNLQVDEDFFNPSIFFETEEKKDINFEGTLNSHIHKAECRAKYHTYVMTKYKRKGIKIGRMKINYRS